MSGQLLRSAQDFVSVGDEEADLNLDREERNVLGIKQLTQTLD